MGLKKKGIVLSGKINHADIYYAGSDMKIFTSSELLW